MASITQGVHHVGLAVRDVVQAAQFFVEVLGFQQVAERPAYPAIFVSDGAILLTLWQLRADAPASDFDRHVHPGLHHLALRVADRATLDALHDRLRAHPDPDVAVEFAPEPLGQSGAQHMMISGPSGIRLEFICVPT